MDNFTQIANKILSESIQNEYMTFDDIYKQPGVTDIRDEMLGLNDKIFDAIDRKDKEAHLAALQEYEDLRDEALAKFGLDGPVGLIDPDMHGEYSDDFKDENGVRPRSDALNTFRNVVEFYADGRHGKIVGDQYVAPEVKSYIGSEDNQSYEDQESGPQIRSLDGFFKAAISDEEGFLKPDEAAAVEFAQKLATDPTRRSFSKDPQKEINKAYGDKMKEIANKINAIQIK
tara:strand:- start:578 stop:1267 length:690 start_codon:yes stop_codon:yes gene_type:complete